MSDLSQGERYLIEQIRKGDAEAWSQLVERFQGRLLAFSRSRGINRSDGEDLVQETFVQFLKGLAAYRRVNQLAMQLLDRDGLLMSCSCSYHLAPGELVDAVQRAARHLGRFAQLVAAGGQSPDHPVHPAIDETRYLRAFLFRVTDG